MTYIDPYAQMEMEYYENLYDEYLTFTPKSKLKFEEIQAIFPIKISDEVAIFLINRNKGFEKVEAEIYQTPFVRSLAIFVGNITDWKYQVYSILYC